MFLCCAGSLAQACTHSSKEGENRSSVSYRAAGLHLKKKKNSESIDFTYMLIKYINTTLQISANSFIIKRIRSPHCPRPPQPEVTQESNGAIGIPREGPQKKSTQCQTSAEHIRKPLINSEGQRV